MNTISSYSSLWKQIEGKSTLYLIMVDNDVFIFEKDDDATCINFFIDEYSANFYMSDIIESGAFRPSQVSVQRLSLQQIWATLPELLPLTESLHDLPLSLYVSQYYQGKLISSDVLHKSDIIPS
jgi:hypothetical protein